ncbi:hypothetical protein [Alicyclobacillus mengziensis]|uniref:Uncharacterized protein n=1 Tax=Alicyclobacillus mengziensis TaxID=2931921 RepID=A0A9X7VWN6_9BACL|nr:hypothetical protein [Alicyclobacillus mengziensis]QSO45945.1 hypothetical protein JZ786_15550 [Alicyclobacillus mengziensis]
MNSKEEQYTPIHSSTTQSGIKITYVCPKEGKTVDEVMAKVYQIASDALVNKLLN